MHRRTVTVLALAVLASAVPAGGVTAAGDRAFPEGRWQGDVIFVAVHRPTGGSAAGGGGFELESDGVSLSGTITWTAATERASATVEASIAGPASAPQIVDGTVATSAGTFPMDRPLEMPISWATCEQVAGYGIGANAVDVSADWLAFRAGSVTDPASFAAEAETLVADLVRLETQVGSGEEVAYVDLIDVADRAVGLAASLQRSPECEVFSATHMGFAAHIMARILELALANPDLVPDATLSALAVAALEVGAIGSGAGDVGAADLEFGLIEELERRIEEAIASGELERLFELGALAQQMGYESLEARAVEGLGGG